MPAVRGVRCQEEIDMLRQIKVEDVFPLREVFHG